MIEASVPGIPEYHENRDNDASNILESCESRISYEDK